MSAPYLVYKTYNPLLFKITQMNWTDAKLAHHYSAWKEMDRVGKLTGSILKRLPDVAATYEFDRASQQSVAVGDDD